MQSLYNNFKSLTENTKSKQISFRIGINKEIKYPIDNIAFVMNDSEFNILNGAPLTEGVNCFANEYLVENLNGSLLRITNF